MKIWKLALSLLLGTALGEDTAVPILYRNALTEGRLENRIAECKDMPAASRKELYAWLESGAWRGGERAIPKWQIPGTFVFRRSGAKDCWVVSLVGNVRHIVVQSGTVGVNGMPLVNNDVRCVINEQIAKLLQAEIERYHPEGAKTIREIRDLMDPSKPFNPFQH